MFPFRYFQLGFSRFYNLHSINPFSAYHMNQIEYCERSLAIVQNVLIYKMNRIRK